MPGALAGAGDERELALFRLHALLVAVAWFELRRRRAQLSGLSTAAAARLARDAADAASASLLGRLDAYRGQSRFEVWAAKFAIREAAAAARRIATSAGKTNAARDTNGRIHFRAGEGGVT